MAQPVELPDTIYVGPVIDEGHSLASVSDKVGGIVLKRKITLGLCFFGRNYFYLSRPSLLVIFKRVFLPY